MQVLELHFGPATTTADGSGVLLDVDGVRATVAVADRTVQCDDAALAQRIAGVLQRWLDACDDGPVQEAVKTV